MKQALIFALAFMGMSLFGVVAYAQVDSGPSEEWLEDGDEDLANDDPAGIDEQYKIPEEVRAAIIQKMMFPRNCETIEKGNEAPRVALPEDPLDRSYGSFRVKMQPGWSLLAHDGILRVIDAYGEEVVSDSVIEISEEFMNVTVERLFGEDNLPAMEELKKRGEEATGCPLPDLAQWFHIVPEPSLARPLVQAADEYTEAKGKAVYNWVDSAKLEYVRYLLSTLPGVLSIHNAPALIPSSLPSPYNSNTNWTGYQTTTSPFTYVSGGDYDYEFHPTNYFVDPSEDQPNEYNVGGLNVWPAWDRGFRGQGVSIGYVEGGWCLDNVGGDPDVDTDWLLNNGFVHLPWTCSLHPDLSTFQSGYPNGRLKYITKNNLKGWVSPGAPGIDFMAHGSSVLGIMAADNNTKGGTGIASQADYYIGQVGWSGPYSEWMDILNRITAAGKPSGPIFLLEWASSCTLENLGQVAACPPELWPEIKDFIATATANGVVMVSIPGNGQAVGLSVNYDQPKLLKYVDGDMDVVDIDFDCQEQVNDFDWENDVTWPTTLSTLNRASTAYWDAGAILGGAGTAYDLTNTCLGDLEVKAAERMNWSSFGSRLDVQAAGANNIAPSYWCLQGDIDIDSELDYSFECGNPYPPIGDSCRTGYNLFPGTSSVGPQITAAAALVQQAYKTVKTAGSYLTSFRMRNALVENGNPQHTLSQDPNVTLGVNFGAGGYPVEMRVDQEPFARIGPRPDMGRTLEAFGYLPEEKMPAKYDEGAPIRQYIMSFNDHQFTQFFSIVALPLPIDIYHNHGYKPDEPNSINPALYTFNISDVASAWYVQHRRSPRIDGGHAVTFYSPIPPASAKTLKIRKSIDPEDDLMLHPVDATDFTLSAWVDLNENTGYFQDFFDKFGDNPWQREYGLHVNENRYLTLTFHDAGGGYRTVADNTQPLQLKRLYYVATTFAKTGSSTCQIKFFIDGTTVRTVNLSGYSAVWTINQDDQTYLGQIGRGLRGTIDEVRFEDRVLPPTELQARYEAGANPPGLVAEWRFDKKSATAIYDPVSAYDGTLTTGSLSNFYGLWGPGTPIGSFHSANSDEVAISNGGSLPPSGLATLGSYFSVEAHFKTPASGTHQVLASSRKQYGSYTKNSWAVYLSNDTLYFTGCPDSSSLCKRGSTTVTADRWTHLVAVYNNGTISLYIDGQQKIVFATSSSSGNAVSYPMYIGRYAGTSNLSYFNAPIDYVRFYNMALNVNGQYGSASWVNTNRNDIDFLYQRRAAIWQHSYYGNYQANHYEDE